MLKDVEDVVPVLHEKNIRLVHDEHFDAAEKVEIVRQKRAESKRRGDQNIRHVESGVQLQNKIKIDYQGSNNDIFIRNMYLEGPLGNGNPQPK